MMKAALVPVVAVVQQRLLRHFFSFPYCYTYRRNVARQCGIRRRQ